MKPLHTTFALTAAALFAVTPVFAAEKEGAEHKHEGKEATVKGEVIDLVCYVGMGATGAKHADCAKECIEKGLPVGLKGEDGKTYVIIGDHKPLNKELAALAAKTVSIKGKVSSRDGINMIENAEIVSK